MAATFKDKATGESRQVEITLLDDSIATNPLRMGNEIEEQLLSLLAANLATGAMLVFVVLGGAKGSQKQ
jgi:hypothetical protein